MPRVTVYTTRYCPYCASAKSLLRKRNIPFEEIIIDEDNDADWEALFRRSGMKTVPQIFAGGELIGGFVELARLDQKDQLASLQGDRRATS